MTEKERKTAVWITAGRGVRYREHPTRKHGQRPDRYSYVVKCQVKS